LVHQVYSIDDAKVHAQRCWYYLALRYMVNRWIVIDLENGDQQLFWTNEEEQYQCKLTSASHFTLYMFIALTAFLATALTSVLSNLAISSSL
jgi:hypothetical protein